MQLTISERNCSTFEIVIYDVSALLWYSAGHLPKWKSRVFVDAFKEYVENALKLSNVLCVFGRYFVNSIKTPARMQTAESSRVHNLLLDMPTPVILSVTKNKVQLNAMLAEALLDPDFYAQATSQNSLIVAGATNVPGQITHDLKSNRRYLSSSHEEAVVIIAQLAVAMSLEDKSVCVVCDDTHVFLLLVHFYNRMCLNQTPMIMASPVRDRAVTDVPSTSAFHNDIASDLLVIHGLSGADTIAALHGIGEAMALKVARKGQFSLGAIVDIEASTDLKTGKSGSSSPKLCTLPPTNEAFSENVKRCQLQVAIWKSEIDGSPPTIVPCDYGWTTNW